MESAFPTSSLLALSFLKERGEGRERGGWINEGEQTKLTRGL
jgi:hypothetical protein